MAWIHDLALSWLPITSVEQYGALPFRVDGDGLAVLLVTTKNGQQWIVPKGWPKRFRTPASTAADEAFEEAGVRGRITAPHIGEFEHHKVLRDKTITCRVLVYPLRVETELDIWPEAGKRERRWLGIDEAQSLVINPSLAGLFKRFAAASQLWSTLEEVG